MFHGIEENQIIAAEVQKSKEQWTTIPLDDVLTALEMANDEDSLCYDFRTKQILTTGGIYNSFRDEDFFKELAMRNPEEFQRLLVTMAEDKGCTLQELLGDEVDVQHDGLEKIADSLPQDLQEWMEELYLDDCIALPSQYDIHEYSMMESFVCDETYGEEMECLERAISGRGAFRRFKDEVQRLGLAQQWYDYRDKAYLAYAREWAEENQVRLV